MAKDKDSNGHAVGNKDPNRRGRGPKGAIGQDIPEDVKDKVKGKGKERES